MKRILTMVLLVTGLGFGVSLSMTGEQGVSPTSGPPLKTDLMTVWSAFRENAQTATARYGGRLVEVTGPVLTVDKAEGEVCLFLFDLDLVNNRPARARCLFEPKAFPELVRLPRMGKVAVRGSVTWEPVSLVGSAIVLTGCTLVSLDE